MSGCIAVTAVCCGFETPGSSSSSDHWSSVDAAGNHLDSLHTSLQLVCFVLNTLHSGVLENLAAVILCILLAFFNSKCHVLELGLVNGQLQLNKAGTHRLAFE